MSDQAELPKVPTRSIALASIIIKDNRQRQEFEPEALQELKSSIEDGGLMHAPVLREEGGKFYLVAGERRLKAISEIFELGGQFVYDETLFTAEEGLVPFTSLGELTELQAEEAELDENLKRKDLTWQEHAAAVARLHALRGNQKKAAAVQAIQDLVKSGTPEEQARNMVPLPVQTVAETAKEVTGRSDGRYQDDTRKEILVAKHLDNPAIARAKSADEALKILKRQEQTKQHLEKAAEVGKMFTKSVHTVVQAECIDWLTNFIASATEDQKFDVICTDPPYGMDAQAFGDSAGRMAGIDHQYDDSYGTWAVLMSGMGADGKRVHPGWCRLAYNACKEQAHAYVFCDIDRFGELKHFMKAAGWDVFRTPFINVKRNNGRVPRPEHGPRRQYEILLYAIKGNKPVKVIMPDVITSDSDEQMTHGAQKPVALYQNLLQRSVSPGDRILDSFAGTGGTIPAGHGFQCFVTAIEQNPADYAKCVGRVEALTDSHQTDIFDSITAANRIVTTEANAT